MTRTEIEDRVRAVCHASKVHPEMYLADVRALLSENRRLRDALAPFAEWAVFLGNKPPQGTHDDMYSFHNIDGGVFFRMSDCVKARAALTQE
jgi:hypothetical protein